MSTWRRLKEPGSSAKNREKIQDLSAVSNEDLIEELETRLLIELDVYSRMVVGWAISKRLTADIALEALDCAIELRQPKAGLIHHSDQGVQYLCEDYVTKCNKSGIHISCSRRGNPYDNAYAETFFKTLKREEVYLWDYETILDVLDRLPNFIEEVYNKKRVHSSLGYLTPAEFEEKVRLNKDGQPILIL